ncbi:cuticle protein-like [Ischnura elegans]|uniref:cuticle protein-like n=1 Tax=Ischnura elegans TaxID=197161 RepID=UPI001ED88A97|nr:cuticle protein-like [Ischnura elegans]
MDYSKILTLLAGWVLAGDHIQAYPLTPADGITGPSGTQHGYGYVVDYYAHPKYQFDYAVHDPHTGDVKKQWESRDGDVVKGSYTIHEPDGTIRTVEYTADKHTGFNAVVKRQGKAYHPQTVISHQQAYDGGHLAQANVEEQGIHAESGAEGATEAQADYGSQLVQYEQQPAVTYQPAPLHSSSHQSVVRHIVSQPIARYHSLPQTATHQAVEHQTGTHQAQAYQTESYQAEPHQASSYQPEQEIKAENSVDADKINELASQVEQIEYAKEESGENEENSKHTNDEQAKQDDGNGYYVPVNFDSQRYTSEKKNNIY